MLEGRSWQARFGNCEPPILYQRCLQKGIQGMYVAELLGFSNHTIPPFRCACIRVKRAMILLPKYVHRDLLAERGFEPTGAGRNSGARISSSWPGLRRRCPATLGSVTFCSRWPTTAFSTLRPSSCSSRAGSGTPETPFGTEFEFLSSTDMVARKDR